MECGKGCADTQKTLDKYYGICYDAKCVHLLMCAFIRSCFSDDRDFHLDRVILDVDFRKADNKRKRNSCEDIALGDVVHSSIHPSLLGPTLKPRFIGSSLIGCRGVSRTRSS